MLESSVKFQICLCKWLRGAGGNKKNQTQTSPSTFELGFIRSAEIKAIICCSLNDHIVLHTKQVSGNSYLIRKYAEVSRCYITQNKYWSWLSNLLQYLTTMLYDVTLYNYFHKKLSSNTGPPLIYSCVRRKWPHKTPVRILFLMS